MRKDKVLCLIKEDWFEPDYDTQEVWMDLVPNVTFPRRIEYVLPLYDHPHNDVENGQHEVHYHQDYRYLKDPGIIHKFDSFNRGRVILPLKKGEHLEYRWLCKISDTHQGATSAGLIRNSNLKHKCIYKGKCPHRGYDLSKVTPIYDNNYGGEVILCPLHSLKFDAKTKDLLTNLDEYKALVL